MTIEEQTLLYTLGQRYSSSSNALAASPDVASYRGAAECRDMEAVKVNYGILNLGRGRGRQADPHQRDRRVAVDDTGERPVENVAEFVGAV